MTALMIITVVLGIACFFIARALIQQNNNEKKQYQLLNGFDNLVHEKKLIVEHSVIVGKRVLAYDGANSKLIVYDLTNAEPIIQNISLQDVGALKIVKERNKQEHIKRLYLELKTEEGKTAHRICFFDHKFDKIVQLPNALRRVLRLKHRIDLNRYHKTAAIQHKLVF